MRRIALLLAAVCLAVMLMNTALAAGNGKALLIATNGLQLKEYSADSGYSHVYLGTWKGNPIKWRVLGGVEDYTSNLMLSEYALDGLAFDASSSEWKGSDAQKWCEDFYQSSFTGGEQIAFMSGYMDKMHNWVDGPVFFLSKNDVQDGKYGFGDELQGNCVATFNNSAVPWMLRTGEDGKIHTVNADGTIGLTSPSEELYARPAIVCRRFVGIELQSAAVGGKPSGMGLSKIADYDGNEWKLTLSRDASNMFTVETTSLTAEAGGTVSVSYTGARTGENEYISAILSDADGNALYYGHIAHNSESGTASFTIPAELALGSYKLRVFNEQCNGDYMTDYLDRTYGLSLTVTEPAPPVVPDTGDGSQPVMYLSLLLASGLGLMIMRRKWASA